MQAEMKITNLVNYLKETCFTHNNNKNIDPNTKYLIFESYTEKSKTMSKNKFCDYLKPLWLTRWSILNIIKTWNKDKNNALRCSFWEENSKSNYKKRYKETSRTKKVDQLSDEQVNYLIDLRENEPNKWYKLFENGLFIPENKEKFNKVFWEDTIVSKRVFYDVINKYELPHRITKRKKIWLLAQHKKDNTYETYVAQMHHVYASEKALHKWQVDIKYLTDIPNYVTLWIMDLYLYEITFRDYKTGLTICYFWTDRSKTSVMIAFDMFKKLMTNIWIDLKLLKFQFDWGAEFSNIRINDVKGKLIEMIENECKWFRLINRKEENGHVESFHRRIEEDLFDTKAISNLKEKLDKWKIEKKDLKKEVLKLLNKYILNFNNHWYSSYPPRYKVFWKKSPIKIIKEEYKEEIETWEINLNFLCKYTGAYDVDWAYNLARSSDYSNIVNAYTLIKEKKIDLAGKFLKLNYEDYTSQFCEFLNPSSSGQIWNGTIHKNLQKY